MAWLSDTGVELQVFDVLGEPLVAAAEVASRVIVSEGAENKSNVQLADGVAGIGVAWQDTSTGTSQLHMQGVGAEGGLPFGTTITVGAEDGDGFDNTLFNNHSMSIGGYDFSTNTQTTAPNGNAVDATASGINVAWVASDPGDTSGFGQIMLQRYQIVAEDSGEPSGLQAAGIDGQVEASAVRDPLDQAAIDAQGGANDTPLVLAAHGRDPVVTGLHTGDTLISWIDDTGHVQARLFPPNGLVVPSDTTLNDLTQAEYDAVNLALSQLGTLGPVADISATFPDMQVVQTGAGNFAIMWVTDTADGHHALTGMYFTLPPDAGVGDVVLPGGDGWTPIPIAPVVVPDSFTGEFHLGGLGEDNPDIVLTYTADDGSGTGIFATHIEGLATGAVDQVFQHSDIFEVNTTTDGNQSGGSVSGTVGDRAIITYLDEGTGDVVARMVDLREPGQFLQGDRIRDRDGDGTLNAGDRIQGRVDVLVGTVGDDHIVGDLPDPALGGIAGVRFDNPEGLDDQLFGGLGNDVIYGGGGNDIIDGGRDLTTPGDVDDPTLGASPQHYTDMAIYQGNSLDYAIWINGDGSYSIVDAHFDDGGDIVDEIGGGGGGGGGGTGQLNLDGLDLVSNVEQFLFLNGDTTSLYDLGYNGTTPDATTHITIDASNFYQLPDQDSRVTGNVDLDTGAPDSTPAGVETVLTPVGWGLTQDAADNGFAVTGVAGVDDGAETNVIAAKSEDSFVTAWQTSNGDGTAALHLTIYDGFMDPIPTAAGAAAVDVIGNALESVSPALAAAGAGPVISWVSIGADGEQHLFVQSYDAAGAPLGPVDGLEVNPGAPAGTVYDSLSLLNTGLRGAVADNPVDPTDPIELDDQFAAVWIQNPDGGGFGQISVQRWVLPLAADGITVEAPVALGLDGLPDGNDGPSVLTDPVTGDPIVGRNVQAAGLEDGHLLVTWAQSDGAGHEIVRGTVISAVDGSQEMAIDLTGILSPDGIAAGTNPQIMSAGEADILVSWIEVNPTGGFDVKAAYYKTTGPETWATPIELDLKHFDTPTLPNGVTVVNIGETTEDIVITWRGDDGTGTLTANDVHGQRYDITGEAVGHTFDVTTGQTAGDTSSTVGLLDGRFVIVHTAQDGTTDVDIRARVMDTNNAIDPVIERDAGGPRGAEPGTVFDDIIDGRDREDTLHGGLGNDVLIGGVNDDTVFGDAGNDTLIGGTGTDFLVGDNLVEAGGNDVLMGGYGRDYISGGDGIDTISYKGESRPVTIDLEAGIVTSDPLHNAVVLPAAGDIAGLPAAALTDASVEDLIGRITVDPLTGAVTFTSEAGTIENAEGSLGNDTILGTAGANVFTGLMGDDFLDGRDGDDTAVFRGNRADYVVTANPDGTFTVHDNVAGRDGTDTVTHIEHLQFADDTLDIGSFVALDDALTLLAGQTVTINVLANDVGVDLQVTSVEGTAVTSGGDPVAVANGTVQLLAGGSLLFTPAAGFLGPIDFDYTIANTDGLESTANVHINVKSNEAPTAVSIANAASIFETNGAAAADIKVGDIAITDDGLGGNTVTLSGDDAAKFKVVGSELFLKAGTLLDTEVASSYSVHVNVSDDTLGGSVGTDFTLPILNVNEAPTGVALSSASIPENSIVGTVVGTLAAIDLDPGDNAGFELVNNANGAFALIGDQIVVANPALLNFEAGATRTISVLATDSGGLTAQQDFTVNLGNLTGTADNIVSGGNNNANTLNGGTGNDFIAGLGGNDRLNGNAGNDVLDGGAGRDDMSGGAGNDTYIVDNSGDSVSETSGQGTDAVLTTLTNYTLTNQVENLVYTGNGAFQGRGNDSSNLMVGAAGNDRLDGGAGNDTLLGGAGADTLLGGRGADRLEGGSGNDTLTGGNDSDMFVFHPGFGDDTVTDFAVGGAAHDVLEIASVYSNLSEMIAAGVITQVGADTVITLDADPVHHDQITIEDVTLASLTADHFHFIS